MKRKSDYRETVCCLVMVLFVGQAFGQAKLSSRRIPSMHIEQFATYNALGEISERAQVPIGYSAVLSKEEPTVVLDFPGGTVAELLHMFTTTVPQLAWTESESGVIHVFKNGGLVSLSDVVIDYPGAVRKSRREIWLDLSNRQEISAWLESAKCSREEIRNGKEFRDHNDPITIRPGVMRLTDLLDEVSVKSGVNYWAILRSPVGTPCTVSIILW